MPVPPCHICNTKVFTVYCIKHGYTLYKCARCYFVFVYPLPTDLSTVYSEGYFHDTGGQTYGYSDYDSDKESMRHIFERYLDTFEAYSKTKTILDIGCATGYFLDRAKERGWETFGVEISDYATQEAISRGHMVQLGKFPDLMTDRKVDIITMWDVLEHVDDPRAYLKKAHSVLNDSGYIAINTVDIGSWWARLIGKRWHLIVPPEHIYYYTSDNLRMLLDQTGFDTIQITKIGKKFSLTYFFMTGYRWQGLRIWKFLGEFFDTPFWRKFAIPVNFRDNIFVLARKRNS